MTGRKCSSYKFSTTTSLHKTNLHQKNKQQTQELKHSYEVFERNSMYQQPRNLLCFDPNVCTGKTNVT